MSYYKPYILFAKTASSSGLSVVSSNNNGSPSSAITATLNGVPAGALLVVCVANNSNTVDNCTISGGGLTWTKRADAGVANGNNAEIHTATFTAGGNITISNTWSGGAGGRMITAFAITGAETTPGGASGTQTAGATPSVSVTTTRANSILFCITSDWNGQDGTSRAFRASTGATVTDKYYYHPDGASSYYVYYYTCTAVQSYTVGMTAPGSQKSSTAVFEVRTP